MYKTTFVCTGCRESARLDFLCTLSSIREKTFRGNAIRKAFRGTGLVPYQPEVILRKLRQFDPPRSNSQRPETSDNNESSSSISTPQSARKIQKIGTQILYLLPDYAAFHRLVERLVKGAIATAHLAKQLEEDLNNT